MPNSLKTRGTPESPIDFCAYPTNDLLYDFLKETQKWDGRRAEVIYYTTANTPEEPLSKISSIRVALSRIRTVKRSVGRPIKDFRFCGTMELVDSQGNVIEPTDSSSLPSQTVYKITLAKVISASLSDLNLLSELF